MVRGCARRSSPTAPPVRCRGVAPPLRGPRGAGRRVVARWAHFESCARDAALVEVPARDLEALPRISEGAALLVRELEEASQMASPGRVMPPEMTEAGLPFGSITGEGSPDQ